jgi:hypothetical protein
MAENFLKTGWVNENRTTRATENPHTTLHGLSGVNQGSGPRANTNGLKLINHP